jgi:CubicO group peptidase (beta-lactamase class C family)
MFSPVSLPRSTPEAQGISSKTLLQWLRALDALEYPNSFILARHGVVIAEGWWAPYEPGVRHQLYSLSKSFTSAAVGWAIRDGLLGLDDGVAGFFPEKLPAGMPEPFRRMKVRHLLTMSSGHADCAMQQLRYPADGDYVRAFFSTELAYEPGTHFAYNSAASYMLSAIVTKLTGKPLVKYLGPRLFEPLGIRDVFWESCPQGINLGGWGLYLSTDEIARFGQVLLDKGVWRGQEVIPTDYLAQATAWQIDNSVNENPDWKQGYGFQFWRSQHNAFRGDGAFGQYALAIPDADMVLATTSGLQNMQSVLTLVWDILLPGLQEEPLPEDPVALSALRSFSANLALPLAGPVQDAVGDCASSNQRFAFKMAKNATGLDRVGFAFSGGACLVTFLCAGKAETLHAGWGENRFGIGELYYGTQRKIAASAAWVSPEHLRVIAVYSETPFRVTFDFHFHGSKLRVEAKSNLLFGTTDWEPMEGARLPG